MMKLKRITAVLLSVIILACMICVPAGAQSYKYKVASVPVSEIIGEGKNLYNYYLSSDPLFNQFVTKDLYISMDEKESYDGTTTFNDVIIYQIDLSNFRSTGKLKAYKVNVDNKLSKYRVLGFRVDCDAKTGAFHTVDFNECLPIDYDEKAHIITVKPDTGYDFDSYNRYYNDNGFNDNGFIAMISSSIHKDSNGLNTGLCTERLTVLSPKGNKRTFEYLRGSELKHDYETELTSDGRNFYVSTTDITRGSGKQKITTCIYKIDESLNEKLIYKKNDIDFYYNAPKPKVIASNGNKYYFIIRGKQLIEYDLKDQTSKIIFESKWFSHGDCEVLNNSWICVTAGKTWKGSSYENEYYVYNIKAQKKINVSKYGRPQQMIAENICIFDNNYIVDLKKSKVIDKYKNIYKFETAPGNDNIYRVDFDYKYNTDNNYINAKLNSIKCQDIVGFDDNKIALVLKNGKAYFVDEDFNQITEAFNAKKISAITHFGIRTNLFTYNDGKRDYFVTYVGNIPSKQEVKTPETTETKSTTLSAPQNVSTKTDSTSISLSWDKVSGASAYRVYIKRPDSSKYELYKNVSSTECKVTGLKSGSKYIFKIAALVTKNGKYKEQTLTDAIKAETAKKSSSDSSSNSNNSSIDPKFKAAMDSYEAFFKKYCDFMKKYQKNPNDSTLMKDYFDYMEKYTDTMKKLDEWSGKDLNNAELKYYLEVTSRINKMLAGVITG